MVYLTVLLVISVIINFELWNKKEEYRHLFELSKSYEQPVKPTKKK